MNFLHQIVWQSALLVSLLGCGAAQSDAQVPAAPASDSIAITVTVGDTTFSAQLEETAAAQAFAERLPLTLEMQELNQNEKYAYLGSGLPTDAQSPGTIQTGDLMLYGSDCVVLFYDSFSTGYSYTRLGRIEPAEGLAQAVGAGAVTVQFAVAQP